MDENKTVKKTGGTDNATTVEDTRQIPDICLEHTQNVLNIFATNLRRNGVNMDVIKTSIKEVWPVINRLVNSASQSCTVSAVEVLKKVELEKRRKDYFGRILIHQLVDFFPPPDNAKVADKVRREFVDGLLPRQIIPGLLNGIKDMFGEEFVEAKNAAIKELASAKFTRAGLVDWEALYLDEEIKNTTRWLLTEIRSKLEKDENREWLKKRIVGSDAWSGEVHRDFEERDYDQLKRLFFRSIS